MATEQREISRLQDLQEQLDDRKRQQEKADEYAPLLMTGRKRLVELVKIIEDTKVGHMTVLQRDAAVHEKSTAIFTWLDGVRMRLTEDFGAAVAAHFNLGKPEGLIIGKSEPKEHEARLLILDALIMQMRSGELHLRVRSAA